MGYGPFVSVPSIIISPVIRSNSKYFISQAYVPVHNREVVETRSHRPYTN